MTVMHNNILARFSALSVAAFSIMGVAHGEALPFLKGADLSSLPLYERAGISFSDGGPRKDVLKIFRDHGANCIRLRLFVNPDGRGCVVNDMPYTIALAKRATDVGYLILLDLHYSDTWTSPGQQAVPMAWSGLSFPALVDRVREYTSQVLRDFAEAGVLPDIVQIGNEINCGILWPQGFLDSKGAASPENLDKLATLLKAGAEGVHHGTGKPCSTRIMLHLANGDHPPRIKRFLDGITQRGVPFDMVGLSFYPVRGAKLEDLKKTLQMVATSYQKQVVIVETAYPWRNHDQTGSVLPWPQTPQGQKQYLIDLTQAVRSTPGGLGVGIIYWHPETIALNSLPTWMNGDLSLFDNGGNALPALDAFRP